jgi:RHS repeat-associated protein
MGKVTAMGMDVITEKSGHQVTPVAVSVCTTPAAPSPLPIPYPVVATSVEGIVDAPMRTKINGAKIATVGSVLKNCHGNEPGTLKEVVSLNTSGPVAVLLGAPTVICELGMMGITGSMCMSNKAPTAGAGGSANAAGGAGGAGGSGGGPGGGPKNGPAGPGGPSGGGGSGGGGSHTGASGPPGSSSGPADAHTCQNGHPVDVVSGDVVDQAVDLSLPGVIPLVWKRYYSSARRQDTEASLGPGWAHGFEQRITDRGRVLVLREAEGREVYFAKVEPGESTFHRRERMTLRREPGGGYQVYRHDERRTYEFAPVTSGGPALLRAIRDAWGNAITLDYDNSRLSRVLDTASREIRVAWEQGRIKRIEVRIGERLLRWVDYAYSASRCLLAAIDALGYADEYEYDRWQRMTAATVKTGARFQYVWEPNTGRCLKTFGPKGLYAVELRGDPKTKTTTLLGEEPRVYTWDDQGHATKEALPDGTVLEERAYDEDGYLIAEVNGAGEGVQYWYDLRGNRTRIVDATGAITAVEFDARDLPVRRVAPDGLVTSYAHDDRGALSGVAYPSGEQYAFSHDEKGRLTGVYGAGTWLRRFEYDARHNLVAETDARGARTTYTYDDMGLPVTRTDALGRTTRVSYDRLGQPITVRYPDGTTTQTTYGAMGKPIRMVDRLGRAAILEYAGMGVLTRVVEPNGRTWQFKYTSMERLAEIKNPRGETYAFTYDDAGRVAVETTFDGRALSYRYSPAGRVERIAYPDASFRVFSYDRAGRIVGEQGSDKSAITYHRDLVGRLSGAVLEEEDRRLVTLLERDALGRVAVERQGDRMIRYGHDARGRRALRVMPNGAITRYAYDTLDALTAVEHNGHRLMIERDVLGRETRRRDAGERLSIQSTYDAMDRLIEQRAMAPTPGGGVPSVLVQRQWQYDRGGRVARIDDGRWGATTYVHDKIDQLVEARRGVYREVFDYDAAGSLQKVLDGLDAAPEAAPAWQIQPGNLVKQTDKAKYAYDKRGRRTGKIELARFEGGARPTRDDLTQYTWDCRDRLREVKLPGGTRVVMTYDAFGRRIRKEVIPASTAEGPRVTEFVWDGDALAADIDTARGVRCFVHEPGTMLPLFQEERGEVLTYVNDHLGMPKELIDPAGMVAWSAAHSAWGNVVETYAHPMGELNRGRKVESPFRLLGQVTDEETGLCWTRFRCFDPEVGRWCSPDPVGVTGGANLFAFNGAPTFDTDPFGLSTGSPHDNVTSVINETNARTGNFSSAHTLTADEALTAGERFLGPGYREIGKPGSGVFLSADGTRRFRMDPNSLRGSHAPNVPHVHLERVDPASGAVLSNNHIPFVE